MTYIIIFFSDNFLFVKLIIYDKAIPFHFFNERFEVIYKIVRRFNYGFECIGILFANPETCFRQPV